MTRNDNTRFSYKYVQRQWTDWKPVYSLKIITKFYRFYLLLHAIECIQRSYCIFKWLRVRSIKDISFPPLQSNSPYSFCKVICRCEYANVSTYNKIYWFFLFVYKNHLYTILFIVRIMDVDILAYVDKLVYFYD